MVDREDSPGAKCGTTKCQAYAFEDFLACRASGGWRSFECLSSLHLYQVASRNIRSLYTGSTNRTCNVLRSSSCPLGKARAREDVHIRLNAGIGKYLSRLFWLASFLREGIRPSIRGFLTEAPSGESCELVAVY